MTVTLIRGNALQLPLADDTVDLIVTSPPYFGLRQYTSAGEPLTGQIGAEATPGEFLDALIAATAEMRRVLKPSGSIFVNLGDRYAGSPSGPQDETGQRADRSQAATYARGRRVESGPPAKSLMLLPERYRIRCVDELGLIVRKVMIWHKPNGLPESVTDRVRSSHEDWVHLTKRPRYYTAVDEIREPLSEWSQQALAGRWARRSQGKTAGERRDAASLNGLGRNYADGLNPLGKLPGSVWTIATQPLNMPPHIAHAVCCAGAPRDDCRGDDHFAAFPMEWPRRLILGWSPPGICTACGEGRRPVVHKPGLTGGDNNPFSRDGSRTASTLDGGAAAWARRMADPDRIVGYACACTPYTDHPGTGERHRNGDHPSGGNAGANVGAGTRLSNLGSAERVGPWREYHLDQWTPPPTRPAVVLDPFSGTGTTALVADVLGRHGIGVDLSRGYLAGARWRTTDPGERARAMQVAKPPPPPPGARPGEDLLSLLDMEGA